MSRPPQAGPGPLPRLAPPAVGPILPPLRGAQRTSYDALSLALREGFVFAALTGPAGSGKTTVLEAVVTDLRDRSLRWIRITDPDKVAAKLAAQIEQIAYAEAGKPESAGRHVVLVIDDAHAASPELLRCVTRLAAMREPGKRVPQVLLVGRPELWTRLAAEAFEPLARRLAVRATLPAAEADDDPWASLEQELTQAQGAADAKTRPLAVPFPAGTPELDPARARPRDPQGAVIEPIQLPDEHAAVPPPSLYALFPDTPPHPAAPEPPERRRRLMLPLGVLFVTVAAFAFALSFYDWPDLLDDLPWAETKPPAPVQVPPSPAAQSPGLPRPPSWAGDSQRTPVPTPRNEAAPAPPKPPAPTAPVAAVPPSPPPVPEPPKPAPPELAQASAPTPAVPAATVQPSAPQPAAPARTAELRESRQATTALPPEIVALLLRRGDEQLALGDLSAARLLFQRAAEAGSAQGARLAARTYDPAFLPPADAGTLADRVAARSWYARAAALGDAEAANRLKILDGGR